MRNETRKRFVWFIGIVVTLCLCFFLCQYIFFELHEMGDWPVVLFIFALIIIVIASFFDARKVMALTPLGYITGFVIGALFNADGVDDGGGRINDFWILWTNTLLILVLIGIVWEIVSRLLKRFRQ